MFIMSTLLHLGLITCIGMQGPAAVVKDKKIIAKHESLLEVSVSQPIPEPEPIVQKKPEPTKVDIAAKKKKTPAPSVKKTTVKITSKQPPKKKMAARKEVASAKILPSMVVMEKMGSKARQGEFPGIDFQYSDPTAFIRQMYSLGCKTLLVNVVTGEYSEVNLFRGSIIPIFDRDMESYSRIKRVIEDTNWEGNKIQAARRMGGLPNDIELLLCVPISVETRWYGYLAAIFKQQNLIVASIDAAEVQVNNAKLVLRQLYLSDGSVRRFDGLPGV